MKTKVLELAGELKTYFEDEIKTSTEISIFLCGGSKSEQSAFRISLGKQISQISSKYTYSVHYPEDMFTELITGHNAQDLLTLENILADSVDCIVILLQSPGTFTELGAFANHPRLSQKLVIVLDPEFKGRRSFISRGPIRYLKYRTRSKIIYSEISTDNLNKLTRQIVEASRDIPKLSVTSDYITNPISSLRLYLALMYVFDPLDKNILLEILKHLSPTDEGKNLVDTVSRTVLNRLSARQEISVDGTIISMTPKGVDTLLGDNIRLTILGISGKQVKLGIDAPKDAPGSTLDPLKLTNVQLTSGEWVPGYVHTGNRFVPSGGNLFFDDRSACPPGWQENVEMRKRLPIGTDIGGGGVLSASGVNVSVTDDDGIIATATANIQHTHSLGAEDSGPPDDWDKDDDGGNTPNATSGMSANTTHPHNVTMPARTGIWCKGT